jgi:hypothetical protein
VVRPSSISQSASRCPPPRRPRSASTSAPRVTAALARGLVLASLTATATAHASPATISPEQGYDLGEILSPRALAFGGAQTAIGTSTTALYGNPAGLPFAHMYHFEGLAALSPEAHRQSYGGAVVDSNTSRLAGGFGGTWSIMDPEGVRRTWTDLRVALAYPLGDRVSVGLGGRYLRASQALASGRLGASLASDGTPGAPIFNGFTFDVGATVAPMEGLRVGLVGKNLTNPGTGLAPTLLQGGIGYATDLFAIEADGLADFTTWSTTKLRAMLGAELFLANHFPIRAGYRFDDGTKTHGLSLGLGYVDRRWSLEISGRRDVTGDHPGTVFVAGLRYFYEAPSTGATGADGDAIGY